MSNRSAHYTPHSSNACIPPPHLPHTASLPAIIAITVTLRTAATSEDRESLIRQRCGEHPNQSRLAEACIAPVSCDHIEDVNSFGRNNNTVICTQQSVITAPHTATLPAIIATTVTRRTGATSEDRKSLIRQRCGGQVQSSLAENCSAPVSSDRIEDVNSNDFSAAFSNCATHQESAAAAAAHLAPRTLQHNLPLPTHHPLHSLTSPHTTHQCRRRISPVRHSAAMWLQN